MITFKKSLCPIICCFPGHALGAEKCDEDQQTNQVDHRMDQNEKQKHVYRQMNQVGQIEKKKHEDRQTNQVNQIEQEEKTKGTRPNK